MKSMSGCFSVLGGWLSWHHKPRCSVSANAFLCNVQKCLVLVQDADAPRISHSGGAQRHSSSETLHELRFVPGCDIFHPLCINRKEDRDLKQEALVV